MLAGVVVLACLVVPLKVHARGGGSGEDRLGVFSRVVVSEEHPAGDIVCAFCTITVDGDVHGDVAVIFSTVMVDDGRTISGDVATLFSTLVVGEGVRINGDLATALGTASLAESAHVGGDRKTVGSGLGLMVVLAPVLIVIGLIWLLVWVVRRMAI